MCQSPLHPLLEALPKCEHHMHVEGSLSPELLFSLAARNGVALPSEPEFASAATLHARYDAFTSLDDFLRYYYIGMSVLQTAADFEALALAYFETAHAARVRHAEVFFDPQAHLERGVALADVVAGLRAAARAAEARWGMTVLLIPCLLRHLPVADSGRLVEALRDGGYWSQKESGLAGLGLCSTERDKPPTLWKDVFAEAKQLPPGSSGSSSSTLSAAPRITAHAGEEGPPEYITLALDHLGAERIDHGVAAARDPQLLARLAREQILLTVCPQSNLRLRGVDRIADVPIRTFLDAGVPFSINSDDPAYFGAYIQDNYCLVQDAHDLAPADWATIVRHSVQGSWCDDDRKAVLLAELDTVMAHWHAGTLVEALA